MAFAAQFANSSYQTVGTKWDVPGWEVTGQDSNGQSYPANIQVAAYRPYTVMWWVNQNLKTSGAMCAQGESAGSGAVAYGLVFYGAGYFLNNAELLSGPPFSDIRQGCQFPNYPAINACGANGTYGCSNYGTTMPWNNNPQFVDPESLYLYQTRIWTNDQSCQIENAWPPCPTCLYSPTTAQSNQNWLNMSIINGQGGNFSFPTTSIAQRACAGNASNYEPQTCPANSLHCPNNSGAQAALFGAMFSTSNPPLNYSFTGINGCNGEEGVTGSKALTPNKIPGATAVQNDALKHCVTH
jgi:hypothetical protein